MEAGIQSTEVAAEAAGGEARQVHTRACFELEINYRGFRVLPGPVHPSGTPALHHLHTSASASDMAIRRGSLGAGHTLAAPPLAPGLAGSGMCACATVRLHEWLQLLMPPAPAGLLHQGG